jgi:hypothetical protein
MAMDAIITLQELQCNRQDRGSKGSSPYIWPAMVVIDLNPFLISVVSPSGNPRVVIEADMQSGQSAAIPASVGVLQRRLDSGDLIQHRVLLVIALWEELDTPDDAVDAGFQAFYASLGTAIQANILQLSSPSQSDQDAAIAAIKAAVKNAVTTAIENSLSFFQKIEFGLGLKQPDNLIDSSSDDLANQGSFTVNFGSVNNSSNFYVLSGELQLVPAGPTTVVPDLFELSATAAEYLLHEAGLVPSFKGTGSWVESQSPKAGAIVAPGSTVSMSLRSGPLP